MVGAIGPKLNILLIHCFGFSLDLGLEVLASASTSASNVWPWSRPQAFGLV